MFMVSLSVGLYDYISTLLLLLRFLMGFVGRGGIILINYNNFIIIINKIKLSIVILCFNLLIVF